jgi:lipoprotein-anchoring transpeptidase ErfK/SrfK
LLFISLVVVGMATQNQTLAQVRVAHSTVSTRQSQAVLAAQIKQQTNQFKIAVKDSKQVTQTYTLDQAGLTIDYNKSAQEALAAKRSGNWLQHLEWWQQRTVPLVVQTKHTTLDTFIEDHTIQTVTPAQDATLTITDGQTAVSESKAGKGFAVPGAEQAVLAAAKFLNGAPLVEQSMVLPPAIDQKEAIISQHKVDAILKQQYSFTLDGQSSTASADDVASWLEITPNPTKHRIDVVANSGAVATYIDSLVPYGAYNSQTGVIMDLPSGGSATLFAGQGGGAIENADESAQQVAAMIDKNEGAAVTLNVSRSQAKAIHAAVADKWLLVDLSDKRMYALEGSSIVNTFLVSAGAPATPTVTGTYHVYAKYESQDMTGANADGTNYFQPNVQWINYFYRDYAVHGNYWRPTSYFGNINSSHGCVGITNDQAKWVYDWAPIGTEVVTYN